MQISVSPRRASLTVRPIATAARLVVTIAALGAMIAPATASTRVPEGRGQSAGAQASAEPEAPISCTRRKKCPRAAAIVLKAPPMAKPKSRASDPAAATAAKQMSKARARERRMQRAKRKMLEPIMNEIAQQLATIADGDPEDVFLYVEIGKGWVTPSVFKPDGDVVRYLESDDSDLALVLLKAWYAEPESSRWSVMEYDLKQGTFSVSFKYPDEVDVEKVDPTDRENALRLRYGKKRVLYPPKAPSA